jgi:hypothetical protein
MTYLNVGWKKYVADGKNYFILEKVISYNMFQIMQIYEIMIMYSPTFVYGFHKLLFLLALLALSKLKMENNKFNVFIFIGNT